MEQWPRSSLAHRVTAGMSDKVSICLTAGVHAERGGKEQIASETETEDIVAFCFLAYPPKILQKTVKEVHFESSLMTGVH